MLALTPHSSDQPPDTWGLVVEITGTPEQMESLLWFCERGNARLHAVTMHVADIEGELKTAIEPFAASIELRTCRQCSGVPFEMPEAPQQP
jgi:3-hydroxyanthranilate 3,4-dioxygenase